jgi:hypothetical protein
MRLKTLLLLSLLSITCLAETADEHTPHYFIEISSGYSYSTQACLKVNKKEWDPSPQGYSSRIGSSPLYQAAIGYQDSSWYSLQLSASYRPDYSYQRFQTSKARTTPGYIGTKTRYFKLSSTALMADIYVNKFAEHWKIAIEELHLKTAPFMGAGIGIAYNNLYDFHSTTPSQPADGTTPAFTIPPRAYSLENNTIRQSFAAQLMLGFSGKLFGYIHYELGYRFFCGGRFESNDYAYALKTPLVVNEGGSSEWITTAEPSSFWRGTLLANECFLGCYGRF